MESEQAKRFDRIIAILIQLQSKKIVKAKDLADRFNVSLRTIYRDVKTLEASGVPILSEPGVGYSIMDGYKLPPVMFTREEAASFVAAEKLVAKYTDKVLEQNFSSAMYKVKSVLRWSEKEMIATLDNSMHIKGKPINKSRYPIPNVLDTLIASIVSKQQVQLSYQSLDADTPVLRNIEPVGLFHEHNNWYIMAYCHLRKAYRQFRTDRILDIKKLEQPFEHQHENLEYFIKEKSDKHRLEVVIETDKQKARYIKGSGRMLGQLVSEHTSNDSTTLTIHTGMDVDSFCRVFLMFADSARIIAPEYVTQRIKHIAQQLKEAVDTY